MLELGWSTFALAVAPGALGFALLAINSWHSPSARRRGVHAHWARGWLVNGIGMSLIGLSWILLAAMHPRLSSTILTWIGVPVGLVGGGLYLAGASRVGRLKSPSRYSLDLDTSGLYSLVRHPQALALSLVVVSLALVTGSVSLLLSLPLWLACWFAYTCFEEELELVPAFGAHYLRYREQTPRLWPRFEQARELLRGLSRIRGKPSPLFLDGEGRTRRRDPPRLDLLG